MTMAYKDSVLDRDKLEQMIKRACKTAALLPQSPRKEVIEASLDALLVESRKIPDNKHAEPVFRKLKATA